MIYFIKNVYSFGFTFQSLDVQYAGVNIEFYD